MHKMCIGKYVDFLIVVEDYSEIMVE